MSKDNLEQKAILIDLMNNEPLISYFKWVSSKEMNKTPEAYANYHTQWHLQNVKEISNAETIGFAEWKDENTFKHPYNDNKYALSNRHMDEKGYTLTELLKIYQDENR